MPYIIYTLSAPAERIAWKDVRYIGIRRDISRLKQHLTPHENTNPEKTAWIQDLLARGTYVKRKAVWYPGSLLDRYQYHDSQDFHLNMFEMFFLTPNRQVVSVFDATDAEFDTFIQQHIPVFDRGQKHWDSLDRMHSILFAWFYRSYPDLFTGTQGGA